MSLKFVNCGVGVNLDELGARCPDGSGIRDFHEVSDLINVTVVGNTATGTETTTQNILVSGTQNVVGTNTLTWAVSMTR
jgi:hypothetical protein